MIDYDYHQFLILVQMNHLQWAGFLVGNVIMAVVGTVVALIVLTIIVGLADGEIFNTVSNGKGLMGAAGPLLPTEDRWAVIAYLRALQLSWLGTTNDLTAEQSAALK